MTASGDETKSEKDDERSQKSEKDWRNERVIVSGRKSWVEGSTKNERKNGCEILHFDRPTRASTGASLESDSTTRFPSSSTESCERSTGGVPSEIDFVSR
jgi:hypothetical protein